MDSKELINKIATKLGMDKLKFEEAPVEVTLAETTLEDGTIVYTSDEMALGVQVYTDAELTMVLPDGEYTLENGTKLEVIDGVVGVYEPVAEIETPEEEVPAEELPEDEAPTETVDASIGEEEANTIVIKSVELVDGTRLFYAPETELAIDTQLFVNEEMTKVADLEEYNTVEGVILKTKAGIVTEILSIIEEYTRMKQLIADNTLDINDMKQEFTALTEINTNLETKMAAIKAEKDAAPAVESINFKDESVVRKVNELKEGEIDYFAQYAAQKELREAINNRNNS